MMADGSESLHDSGEIMFAPRPWASRTMPRLVPLAVAAVVLVIVGGGTGSAGDFAAAGSLVPVIVLVLLSDTRAESQAPVRLDATGVSWSGAEQTLDWAAVDHAVVRNRARVWKLLGVFGSVGLVDTPAAAFAARAATRPTVRSIDCRDIDTDVDEITAALQRFAPQIPLDHLS